jgi:hypothetical protein
MKRLVFACLLFSVMDKLKAQLPSPVRVNDKMTIGFNVNIELLGFAYFIGFEGVNSDTLMMNVEGKQMLEKDWLNYGYHFYLQYRSLAASPHLQDAFTMAGDLWLSHIIPLLLQVAPFPDATLTPQLPTSLYVAFSPRHDTADARQRASRFLQACNAFYREAKFDQYLASCGQWYRAALQQVRSHLPNPAFVEAMETFYRKKMDSYQLIPSLTLPKTMGFGPLYNQSGITRVYNVFGAYALQNFLNAPQPDLGFGNTRKLRELSVHEFGHSFVNPVLEQLPDSLIRKISNSFKPIRAAMEAQGYNTWESCLIEHFVRAGEVVIARHSGYTRDAQKLEAEYIKNRKFIYLPRIIAALEAYRKSSGNSYAQTVRKTVENW